MLSPLLVNATNLSKYIDNPDIEPSLSSGGALVYLMLIIIFLSFYFPLKIIIWIITKIIFFLGVVTIYCLAVNKFSQFISFGVVGKSDGWIFFLTQLFLIFLPIYLYWICGKDRDS